MNIRQFLHNARHARTRESPLEITDEAQQGTPAEMRLPFEATMPSLSGATAWLNSPPLSAAGLRGNVVLVDFWTYTCVNWLRTLPYVRAWAEKYKEHGVVVIGVHTPEFPFEHDIEHVRRAAQEMRVEYPIAVDSDYAIWDAFANHYWPALYIADAQGHLRTVGKDYATPACRGWHRRLRSRSRLGRCPGRGSCCRLWKPQVSGNLYWLRTHRGLYVSRWDSQCRRGQTLS